MVVEVGGATRDVGQLLTITSDTNTLTDKLSGRKEKVKIKDCHIMLHRNFTRGYMSQRMMWYDIGGNSSNRSL